MNDNPSAPPAPHVPRFNKLAGATSGPYEGNVRAVLALTLTVAFLGLLGYASVEYIHFQRAEAHDFVVAGFGALLAAFSGVIGLYIGARTAQGG